MEYVFTGFDSAWGGNIKGAICDLVLHDGALLPQEPVNVTWDDAVRRIARYNEAKVHIWAVDQPICLTNLVGARPVETRLAQALMADFRCGAHSSNLANGCWSADAGIWRFLQALVEQGYRHDPIKTVEAQSGKFFFECFPHPALLGLFDLSRLLKYKVRHHDASAWQQLIQHLQSLDSRQELPISNIRKLVPDDLKQTKANEDKLDAILCAYTAAYWWKFGTSRSTMLGDLISGYIVTPHSKRTLLKFKDTFGADRINQPGEGCKEFPPSGQSRHRPPIMLSEGSEQLPPTTPSGEWNGQETLIAVDTTNLWRNSRGRIMNPWMNKDRMNGWRLWVRLIEEDGQPELMFEPFAAGGDVQQGMRSSRAHMNGDLWRLPCPRCDSRKPNTTQD